MVFALSFYFLELFFTSQAYGINLKTTTLDIVLVKGLVGIFLSLLITQILDVNPFKFNLQFNLSLDDEEITDIKTMKLCVLTGMVGSAAFLLQTTAIK